jgi:predicted PhzF superfamily epimerase YddE/YHI9
MTDVWVLRVFTDQRGRHGNPLGIILNGAGVARADRQRVAAELGFADTVFVDDVEGGHVQIFAPAAELPFAGHPLVGTAWALGQTLGRHPQELHPSGGATPTWLEGEQVWVRGRLAATPAWWHERLPAPEDVDSLEEPQSQDQDATQLWAWQAEREGQVRARVFASRFGVREDEACGSASMRLAAALGRKLTVHHGNGSTIFARPGPPGTAEVGGFVVSDDMIPLP